MELLLKHHCHFVSQSACPRWSCQYCRFWLCFNRQVEETEDEFTRDAGGKLLLSDHRINGTIGIREPIVVGCAVVLTNLFTIHSKRKSKIFSLMPMFFFQIRIIFAAVCLILPVNQSRTSRQRLALSRDQSSYRLP